MNFFKSIILDDEEPQSPRQPNLDSALNPPPQDPTPNDGWSFGSLIKTLATTSESMIETYSRDLKEFGSGLRKESDIIREAATRAVKELPASIEAGTSAAQGVLKSTAEIILQEPQLSDGETDTPEINRSLNLGRYSRFEAQLSAIQTDLNTFCQEPDDLEDYDKWRSSFTLDEKSGEIEGLIGENGALDANFRKIVPNVVDHDTFWCRYFYRVDKLEQQEKFRANLVKRAISVDEEDDELSWDVDDDEEKDGGKAKGVGDNGNSIPGEKGGSLTGELQEGGKAPVADLYERETTSDKETSYERLKSEESVKEKTDENVGVKGEAAAQVVKTEEEDIEWDEIEDIGSDNDKKDPIGERPNREELRKQLSAADDAEDLSWDIEEDDEPVKT
ncbi:BSD domain-containing protein 1 [Salvia hispanica]|uniref:BSD domain-containing protein 1 n=1 Tax=Salvia hispanica TaxID=49212 RepID=UPI002009BF83|nr:BSD domain-containing protein 1 [Salvia hispanica]